MLSKPLHGWTDFQLEGTGKSVLSYLTDIPFEWLDQAIYGLETMSPFCVKAYLEPGRFLCLVSYWNCYVFCESEESHSSEEKEISGDSYPVNMLQFCKNLHDDISENIDDWVSFAEYTGEVPIGKKAELNCKLDRLKELIAKHEDRFDNSAVTLKLGDDPDAPEITIGASLW